MAEKHTFRVNPEDVGLRLDQLLARRVPGMSRTAARRVLAAGGVFIDKKRVKVASRTALAGQNVTVSQLTETERLVSQELASQIQTVFEDPHLVVIDKPSGLLTAPSDVSDQNNALAFLQAGRNTQLYLVHRLDRLTSGLLVFAKDLPTTRALSLAFQHHDLERRYLALLHGRPSESNLTVEEPLDGRAARTYFNERQRFLEATLMAAKLDTGRTHQVRRHADFLGCPIVGDPLYRPEGPTALPPCPRLLLHAEVLGFAHPASGAQLSFESPLPPLFSNYIARLPPQP